MNSYEFTEEFKTELSEQNETLAKEFIQLGGVPALSQEITVFGQTYEGFEVIDKLTALETTMTEDGQKIPVEDIMIESIEIGTYNKAEADK